MRELLESITKKEWRFVGLISLALMVLTGLPYLYGYFAAPAGFSYNGLTSLTPADNPVYYSYINQIEQGHFLIKDLFTTEVQPVGMFNIFWLTIGLIAKFFSLSPALAFHLARLALIPVFIIVAYLFISLFFASGRQRKFCLLLLLFSAGLGAYFIGQISAFDLASKPGYWTPNDIWIPESIVFLTLYKTPHFIVSLTLMLLIFLLMIFAFSKKYLGYTVIAGILALIYFNFHPFYIPMVFGTLGLYLLGLILQAKKILWRPTGYFLLFTIIASPSIVYHFWILLTDPVMQQRAFQNITLAPPFVFILIGYGLLWPLAILGVAWLIKTKQLNSYFLFLLVWLIFSVISVNLPIQFQSRYTQGLHLPLVIFAATGLFLWAEKVYTPKNMIKYRFWLTNKLLAVILFIVLLAVSNIFNVIRDLYYFTLKPRPVFGYFYLSQDKITAIKQLANLGSRQKILANDAVDSLFIPGLTNQIVYLAHSIETIDYPVKIYYWQWFFGSDQQAEKKYQFLTSTGINYLFFNLATQKPDQFDPATKNYLQLIYQNSGAAIYRVNTAGGESKSN